MKKHWKRKREESGGGVETREVGVGGVGKRVGQREKGGTKRERERSLPCTSPGL